MATIGDQQLKLPYAAPWPAPCGICAGTTGSSWIPSFPISRAPMG
jgi:hypothetical protein